MFKLHKYHVAISVAEPELVYASELAAALKKNRIKYYFYEEHPQDAGLPLIELITRIYGSQSCVVVVLQSEDHERYWGGIERKIAQAKGKRTIVIKLDDFPLDSYYENFVYLKWKDGLQRIVGALKRVTKWCRILPTIIYGILITLLFLACLWIASCPRPCKCSPGKRVLITMPRPDKTGVDSFEISSTEITVAEFSDYCKIKNIPMPGQPAHRDLANCPVTNITSQQAMDYARWRGGRLPVSGEWGYAARANENTNYSGSSQAGKVAVYNRDKLSRVGTKCPNAFGLCDMTGNAAEWCTDVPYIVPNDSVPVCGGAYNSPVNELHISHINYRSATASDSTIGFRVVWDITNTRRRH